MNSDSTKHGPYEYDRTSDLIGRPYQTPDEEAAGWLKERANEGFRRQIADLVELSREQRQDEIASGALVVLVLVFAGVVLWKVWVG